MSNLNPSATYSGRKYCPACNSSKWSSLGDCVACGREMCDACEGAVVTNGTTGELLCHICAELRRIENLDCECVFSGDEADNSACELHSGPILGLRPITARVRMPNIPEWNAKAEERELHAIDLAGIAKLQMASQVELQYFRVLALAGCTQMETKAALAVAFKNEVA